MEIYCCNVVCGAPTTSKLVQSINQLGRGLHGSITQLDIKMHSYEKSTVTSQSTCSEFTERRTGIEERDTLLQDSIIERVAKLEDNNYVSQEKLLEAIACLEKGNSGSSKNL